MAGLPRARSMPPARMHDRSCTQPQACRVRLVVRANCVPCLDRSFANRAGPTNVSNGKSRGRPGIANQSSWGEWVEDRQEMPKTHPSTSPRKFGSFRAFTTRVIGRSSGFEANRLSASRLLLTVASQPSPASACDGGRSSIPLRGNPGITPGSLLRHRSQNRRTNNDRNIAARCWPVNTRYRHTRKKCSALV